MNKTTHFYPQDKSNTPVSNTLRKKMPASEGQKALWFSCQNSDVEYSYNQQLSARVDRHLNMPLLTTCMNALVERHEALRTTFEANDDGELLQVINKPYHVEIPTINVGSIDMDEKILEEEITKESIKQGRTKYDLSKGPLFRTTILQLPLEKQIIIFSFHQLIIDGRSMDVILEDWQALDAAFHLQKEPKLKNTILQFSDYSYRENNFLSSEQSEPNRKYWKTIFENPPDLLNLPYKNPWNPETQKFCDREFIEIPRELFANLKKLESATHCSINTILLGALQVLIMRYTGQTNICIGSQRANRNQPEFKSTIGYFTNMAPILNNLSGGKTFQELLHETKSLVKKASYLYPLPYGLVTQIARANGLATELQPCQVVLNFSGFYNKTIELDSGPTISHIRRRSMGDTKFPLLIGILSEGDDLVGYIEYDINLFDRDSIQRFYLHYLRLLESIVESPIQDIHSIPFLSDAERQQILYDWNDTKIDFPYVNSAQKMFEVQVDKTLDCIAVHFEDQHLSYGKLNKMSNQLAHHLIRLGAGPDERIGLCVERSPEMLIGLLAILKSGGAYVPLDSMYPKERISYMIDNADVSILLTQSFISHHANEKCTEVIYLDKLNTSQVCVKDNRNPKNITLPNNLAYVIYTSGSTGMPKAVSMPHRALVNLIQWQQKNSINNHGNRTLQFSPISFDVSFQEIFSTWSKGGVLTLIDNDVRRDPFQLWKFLNEKRINCLFMPFIALQQLSETYSDISEQNVHSLTEVISAGEQLQITPLIRELFKDLPGCKLYNQYGPSETHVVTALELEGSPEIWEALPTIGRPIANNTIYILDRALQPVPVGVVGELYIGGIGVARGYLNRDDLTKDRFIDNPFADGIIYKTGDLARYRPNRDIEYRGRTDDQIKIRGYRIELGEIENSLTELEPVLEAAVVAHFRDSLSRDKYIIAYIVLKPNKFPQEDRIREELSSTLPDYMVPSIFVFLETLPLTPSGKVDRKALPEPEMGSLFKQEYIAPTTEVEKRLVHIWSKVLSLPENKIGIQNNFFSLGGHSMLAAQVASQIRKYFNIPIKIKDLFNANTIQKLAALIDISKTDNQHINNRNQPLLVKVKRTDRIPIKNNHKRALQYRKNCNNNEMPRSTSNIVVPFRILGTLNVAAMVKSFCTLIIRHEILRTTFSSFDADANQIISNEIRFNLPIIDTQESEIPHHIDEFANHTFDILNGPLFKSYLLRISSNDHVLILNTDHIISDDWSQAAMHRDLSKLYESYSQNKSPKLPPLSIQFADYVYWMEEKRKSIDFNRQLQFWTQLLRDAPLHANLPFDKKPPNKPTYRRGLVCLDVSPNIAIQLQRLSQLQEASLFMTMHAIYNILIHCFTGQTDICSITLRAGRDLPELHDLIGPLYDNQIFRIRIHKDKNFKELLEQEKSMALSAYDCSDVSIADVRQILNYNSKSSIIKFTDFNYLGLEQHSLTLKNLNVSPIENDRKSYGGTLSVGVIKKGDHLRLFFTYNKDVFKNNTIQKLGRTYLSLLEDVVNNPEQSIDSLSSSYYEHLRIPGTNHTTTYFR